MQENNQKQFDEKTEETAVIEYGACPGRCTDPYPVFTWSAFLFPYLSVFPLLFLPQPHWTFPFPSFSFSLKCPTEILGNPTVLFPYCIMGPIPIVYCAERWLGVPLLLTHLHVCHPWDHGTDSSPEMAQARLGQGLRRLLGFIHPHSSVLPLV